MAELQGDRRTVFGTQSWLHAIVAAGCLFTSPLLIHPALAENETACQAAIATAERVANVPNQLLDAISRVESGRYDPVSRSVRAWPWTINAQGTGHYYASREEAVAAARAFQAAGVRSMDVGCMQINLMYHPDGFADLEQAFDPSSNALYAARFLVDLFHQTGSWPHAAAAYHSQTPDLGTDYQRKVLEAWAEPIDRKARTDITASDGPPRRRRPSDAPVAVASAATSAPAGAAVGSPPLGGLGRIIRLPGAGGGPTGRGLAAYRLMPVMLASRMVRPSPAVGKLD